MNPTLDKFSEMFGKYKKVPVYKEIPIFQETTVSVVDKLEITDKPFSILESGKGPSTLSRYTYIGFDPHTIIQTKGNIIDIKKGSHKISYNEEPYQAIKKLMNQYTSERISGLPEFYGGAMGYFSYDFGRFFESMPEYAKDDLSLPESYFMLVDKVVCLDYVEEKIKIIVLVSPEDFTNYSTAYEWAAQEVNKIEERLKVDKKAKKIIVGQKAWQNNSETLCNVTKEQFESMVEKAKEYILAGDIFQVNLSLRLCQKINIKPFNLYQVLREVNPSPYMCFIDFGDMQIVGSSPELLVRIRDGWAETRPIAGTRRRGENRDEDIALAMELINNEKERAEHIMLVDLERNDLGRVCSYGTVEVNELMVIEEYSHVMHIVSNVRGKLSQEYDRFDLLKACFPGGTITGAPKIRSMEIIEELEPTRRGVYTGSIGFLGCGGELEMNISIRSIIIKDKFAYVQAGAGIVADSIPEREYLESMKKAEALLRAMEIANDIFTWEDQ